MKNWDKSKFSSFSQKVKMMNRYNDTVVEPEFLKFVGVQRHASLRPTEDG